MRHPDSGAEREVAATAVKHMAESGWIRLSAAEVADREKARRDERDKRRAKNAPKAPEKTPPVPEPARKDPPKAASGRASTPAEEK